MCVEGLVRHAGVVELSPVKLRTINYSCPEEVQASLPITASKQTDAVRSNGNNDAIFFLI